MRGEEGKDDLHISLERDWLIWVVFAGKGGEVRFVVLVDGLEEIVRLSVCICVCVCVCG